jgi:sulfate transport system permease protein
VDYLGARARDLVALMRRAWHRVSSPKSEAATARAPARLRTIATTLSRLVLVVIVRPAQAVARGIWRRKLRLLVVLYLGLLIGLPVGYLFQQTFSSGFEQFWHDVTAPGSVSALELSMKVALVVVPVNTVAGLLAAVLIVRRRVVGRRLLDLSFDLPIAVSPIIIGIALFLAYAPNIGWFGHLLTDHGIMVIFSPLGIGIATMAVTLPYVLRSVVPVLVEVGESEEQAARTLGANAFRRFFTVTLPAIRWALLFGVIVTLARSLGEFAAVLVVTGNSSNNQTMPLYIYNQWDQLYNAAGADAGAVLLASISIFVLLFLSILRSVERRRRVDLA